MQQHTSSTIRPIRLVLGLAVLLLGLAWIGQGIGIIGGGFMSGDQRWAGIGIVLAVLGAYLAATAIRRRT